jgi:ABC-type sugar transport system ATPase subunit
VPSEVELASVSTIDIRKQFGEITAVNGVSLEARDGEFMVLLGPSGCGKTTLLRSMSRMTRPR